ncbi:acetolactate synthase 2 small subunit [Aeromonas cavernicola]|uniref:Acetolactate synthase 2 small subunit n=1 Tax=Aeromonas cavernicola TaxID=1006623 RepID=A0A2H9U212_9GAMM|nr:acetolactate synthase 2 small subunit [Aeromonas cavernicola]PJG58097.1 acetolactate synthase 2 small subunit [Aeromonas cavernicola]
MNQVHTLTIHAKATPEVMERVLRVVRHRGFSLRALNMETAQDSQQLQITVTVESLRPIQQLWAQLDKLVDVARVDALEQHPRIRA